MTTLTLQDDGAGSVPNPYGVAGSVNYTTKALRVNPACTVKQARPIYGTEIVGTETIKNPDGSKTVKTTSRTVVKGIEYIDVAYTYPADGADCVVRYQPQGGGYPNATETVTLDALAIDVTKGYAEQVARGSLRFRLGGSLFVDQAGAIYRDPSPKTGAGSASGSLDPSSGRVRLSNWVAGGDNAVTLEGMTTQCDTHPVDRVSFRTPVSPVKPGTMQIRWSDLQGNAHSKAIDSTGILEDADCSMTCDYERGLVHARFGRWRTVSSLTAEELNEPWYDPDAIISLAGVPSIWRPRLVEADTIIYNAVASTYLPPDSDLLGLDAARLPPDGKALIFGRGRLVLVHHTDSVAVATLSPTQQIDCGRTRLYRVSIEDSKGARLGADQFTVDRVAGTVTMSASLITAGFSPPWSVRHTVADLAQVVDIDISGRISLRSQLTHAYPADESLCSGVLYVGTLQARVSNLFAQSTWTNEWSDSLIGDEPLAQYNAALYPVQVSNAGAYSDRFLVRFTSATEFHVVGEHLGLIAIGDVNTDCSPINSLTGEAYFTLDHRGWGAGWSTGDCLRFNLHGACYPVDLIRATQPSEPTGAVDSVELLFTGNVDA